jgi:hypothetical protein
MASYDFGIRAISPALTTPHVLGFGAAPTFNCFEVWNGPTNASMLFKVGPEGDVIMGNNSGGSIATDASHGFFGLRTCAGAPTGTPDDLGTTQAAMVYDRTNHRLYIYLGAWRSVALS